MSNCIKCSMDMCEVELDCEGNASIRTNFRAFADGKYVLKLNYLDVVLIKEQDFTTLEVLEFQVKNLNENYAYSFWVENEIGEVLEYISPNNKRYTNFTFTTHLSKYID